MLATLQKLRLLATQTLGASLCGCNQIDNFAYNALFLAIKSSTTGLVWMNQILV